MVFRAFLGRAAIPASVVIFLLALGCSRPQPCQDPTQEGVCFCPIGISCHHQCGQATGHCTLGCSQANPSCSVSCGDDCTALCSGAGRCQTTCGDHCNVSCDWVKENCSATVGESSRVNCEGAADCDILCRGTCDVACPGGRCRVRCAAGPTDCELSCGGGTAHERPRQCPDGSWVCGRSC